MSFEKKAQVFLIPALEVTLFWSAVSPLLDKVSSHSEGELEADDFLPLLREGQMELWIAIKDKRVIAAMITQVIPYPRKNVLRIISIAGEQMDLWMDQIWRVEDFARARNCRALELWGRKGWLKILKDWKNSYHVLTKEL